MVGNLVSTCSSTNSMAQQQAGKTSNIENTKMADLMKILIESFAQSFDKTEKSKEDEEREKQIKDLIPKADTDKDGTLSLDELYLVDTTDNEAQGKLVNNLIHSFKSIDKNKDGELSLEEMKRGLKQKAFSLQELASMGSKLKQQNVFNFLLQPALNVNELLAQKSINNYAQLGL